MRKEVEAWQKAELTDVTAKVVIYEAFVEGKLEAPKHLVGTVHDLDFEPKYEEFRPRSIWSPLERIRVCPRNSRGFLNSGRLPNRASSWRLDSRNRSRLCGGVGQGPSVTPSSPIPGKRLLNTSPFPRTYS